MGEYIEQAKKHRRIKQVAKMMVPRQEDGEIDEGESTQPRPRTTRGVDKPKSKCKFPLWKENTTWSEYEPMIAWHHKTLKKDPEDQFMDLVNALNDSNREEVAKRLMQNFRDCGSMKQIMEDAV